MSAILRTDKSDAVERDHPQTVVEIATDVRLSDGDVVSIEVDEQLPISN